MAGLVAAAILMAICALYYFLTFFLDLFPERAFHCKSAMTVVLFAFITLPIAGSAYTVSMFKRGT